MEEGSLRCDANISVRPIGQTALGTKTELKNMNSFRGVEKALEYEYRRQVDVVSSGGKILQQTFQWDAARNISVPMRGKESAPDYRYFPEPDLVPLVINESWIEEIKKGMPELPSAKYSRFKEQYDLNDEHVQVLTDSRLVADYFEKAVSFCKDTKLTANWVMGEILRLGKEKRLDVDRLAVTPTRLGSLLSLVGDGTISPSAAKKILNRIEEEDREPRELLDEMGLKQISDTSALEVTVRQILDTHPDEVKRFKGGQKKLSAFFVGQAMKMTKGKGNPKEINKILSKLLGE